MRIELTFLFVFLSVFVSCSLQAAISDEGYYYAAKPVGGDATTIFLKGPYSTEAICTEVRSADYGDGDYILPWDGGPGCFYIYPSDIDNANELYGIAMPYSPLVSIGLKGDKLNMFLDSVHELDQAYDIAGYNDELNNLIRRAVNRNR